MPLPDIPPTLTHAPAWAGVGLEIPPREADCSGRRPSWFPFQVNVCDCDDDPDPTPLSERAMRIPPPSSSLPFDRDDPCR